VSFKEALRVAFRTLEKPTTSSNRALQFMRNTTNDKRTPPDRDWAKSKSDGTNRLILRWQRGSSEGE
jgi:hypothetical protein